MTAPAPHPTRRPSRDLASGPVLSRPHGIDPAEVTRCVVRAFGETLGRGPTRARTSVGEDVLTIVLNDTLSRLERTLVEHDRCDAVEAARHAIHGILERRLAIGLEPIARRPISSVHIQHRVETDVVVVVAVLGAGVGSA